MAADFFAGWVGGVLGLLVGHPIETIKVRQQTYGTTMLPTIVKTFKYEGLLGFYKGSLFPFFTMGPSNAIFFGVYGNCLDFLQASGKRIQSPTAENRESLVDVFNAGLVGGFVQVLFTCPVELIKTTMQAQTGGKAGSWDKQHVTKYNRSYKVLADVLKTRGVKGLFRGFIPMLIRDLPTSGVYTASYTFLVYSFSNPSTPAWMKEMIAGGFAGVLSWILVIPMDVVKSRIQTDNPDNPIYKGFVHCMKKSYQDDGLKIFFRGLPAITVRAFLVNAMTFIGYEEILKFFHSHQT